MESDDGLKQLFTTRFASGNRFLLLKKVAF